MPGSVAMSQMEFALLSPQLSERGSKKSEENSSVRTLCTHTHTHIPKVAHLLGNKRYVEAAFAFSLLWHWARLQRSAAPAGGQLTWPRTSVSSNSPWTTADGDAHEIIPLSLLNSLRLMLNFLEKVRNSHPLVINGQFGLSQVQFSTCKHTKF